MHGLRRQRGVLIMAKKPMAKPLKEGSPADMRGDKKLSKKFGMSMKEWEKSPMDKAHDAGKMKAKKGGRAK